MRTLTNDYHDFELVNLTYSEDGRGPYVIRQDGVPPGADLQEEDRFLLRHDGVWVLNFIVHSLSEEAQEKFLYPTIKEIQDRVQSLAGKPTCEATLPKGKSRAEILQDTDTTRNRIWQKVREAKGSKVTLPGT